MLYPDLPIAWALTASLALPSTPSAVATGGAPTVIAKIDLSRDFGLRPGWIFIATQEPPTNDPTGLDDTQPGQVHLCIRAAASAPCSPQLADDLRADHRDASPVDSYDRPRYLDVVRIVRPRGRARPPLLIVTASGLRAGNGNQLVLTQALSYDPEAGAFVRIYRHSTGRNNNEEVRYIESGPLEGAIISAEPTADAPFGYWITVDSLRPDYTYKHRLRYRSATRYSDGNELPVIDSEMPNIQRRLGYWRPGTPLPLPATPCPKPRLVRTALWCS